MVTRMMIEEEVYEDKSDEEEEDDDEDEVEEEDEDEVEEGVTMRIRMRLRVTTRCDYRDASQGSPSCDDLPAYPQALLDYHQY